MCGRFTLRNFEQVKSVHDIIIDPSYNIAPSQQALVIKEDEALDFIDWSFSPFWAKKPFNLINVQYDSLDVKPSFKNYKKCVFLADGWYEWVRLKDGSSKPIFIHLNNDLFYFAAIYNDAGGAIVTIDAQASLKNIHHRQPMVLNAEEIKEWLFSEKQVIFSKIIDAISSYEVSKYVNSPRNNDTKCVQQISEK